jgi:predicted metal-binding membrane protein
VATAPSHLLHRQRNWILISLAILSAGAWTIVVRQAHSMGNQAMGLTMGMDATLFLAVWVAMMIAMMFPAAAPMILMFAQVQAGKRRQGGASVPIWLFTGTYLALWAAVGVAAYLTAIGLQQLGDHTSWLADNGPRLGGLLLIGAGLYQFTPLKHACLTKCRSPLAFVMTSWRDGPAGAVRMGLTHGLYCLGCCWLLFAILFPLGMMNIAVLAVFTLLIFAEKSLPFGDRLAWITAIALIAYGLAILISPQLLPLQPPHRMQM